VEQGGVPQEVLDLRSYRLLSVNKKAKILLEGQPSIVEEFEGQLSKRFEQHKKKGGVFPDPRLVEALLKRIKMVLEFNYLEEFYHFIALEATTLSRKSKLDSLSVAASFDAKKRKRHGGGFNLIDQVIKS
jgi:hypothetical protein